jgi:hypothetical protein
MAAFNTVVIPEDETCSNCGHKIKRRVQFKYGARRAYEYAVGDTLKWGTNDLGVPARLVKVEGYPEPCPDCGYAPDGVYDVIIRDNVIERVVPNTGEPYPPDNHEGYIILEP